MEKEILNKKITNNVLAFLCTNKCLCRTFVQIIHKYECIYNYLCVNEEIRIHRTKDKNNNLQTVGVFHGIIICINKHNNCPFLSEVPHSS